MFDTAGLSVSAYGYDLAATSGGAAHIGSAPGAFIPATLIVEGAFGNAPFFSGTSTISADSFLHVGRDANSRGVLELDGARWESDDTTFVGLNGEGTLKIRDSGSMSNGASIMGFAAGSSGTVTIDSGAAWTSSGDMTIGALGTGSVTLNDGAVFAMGDTAIAAQSGSTGTLVVNDNWQSDGSLYVGGGSAVAGGTGSLTIGGAVVVEGDMKVYSTGSLSLNNGFLRVDGHLQWLKAGPLTVNGGDILSAEQLTISSGGSLVYAHDPSIIFDLRFGQLTAPANSFTWTSGNLQVTG
jgi:T5SS/PEP-CTERM-associated repeat protein